MSETSNVENSSYKFSNPEITEELSKMFAEDQEIRNQLLNEKDEEILKSLRRKMEQIDFANTLKLQEIVEKIGWPTNNKVGAEASHFAWTLIQHADHNPELQEKYLKLMQEAYYANPQEVSISDIAYLTDRVANNFGRPQTYGTQMFTGKDSGYIQVDPKNPDHIIEPEKLDERRAAVGLPPYEEYVKEWRKQVGE